MLFVPAGLIRLARPRAGDELLLLIAVVGVFVGTAVYAPDVDAATVELLRLGMNLAVVLAMFGILRTRDDVVRVLRMFRESLAVVAPIMVVQYLTGIYLWNSGLAVAGRLNGPFADPNVAARFLLIGIVLAVFMPPARKWGIAHAAWFAEIGLLGIALILSGSRSVYLAAAGLLVATLVFGDERSRRQVLGLTPLMASAVGLAFVAVPAFHDRLETFKLGRGVLGSRTSLISGGLAMFRDHPLDGVGLGGYPSSLLGPYAPYQGYYGASQTASHTSIITTLAEFGLLGASLLLVVFFCALVWYRLAARLAAWARLRVPLALFLGFLTILIASQSEGRFWEEPMLWVVLGLAAVCRRVRSAPAVTDAPTPLIETGWETRRRRSGAIGTAGLAPRWRR